MNRLPTIVEALDRTTMETSAKQEVGKFRAKYFEKKNPSKNGYFVKDVQIEEVISFNKKTIKIAGKLNLNREQEIVCIKLKLKNEDAPYCLSF